MKASTAKVLAAKHWREFAPVKAWAARGDVTGEEELDDLRYALYERALGPPPKGRSHWSLADLRGPKFDKVITEFRRQSGTVTLADGFAAENADQIAMLHSIAALCLDEPTVAHIARDKFQGSHWSTLTAPQLQQLQWTCKRYASRLPDAHARR